MAQLKQQNIFQIEKQNQKFLKMWLSSMGLPQYIGVFIIGGFDLQGLIELDDKTLCEMDILDQRHRLIILQQAQKLKLQQLSKNVQHKHNYSQPYACTNQRTSAMHLAQSHSNPVNPPINDDGVMMYCANSESFTQHSFGWRNLFQNENQYKKFLSMIFLQYTDVFIKNEFDLGDVVELDDKTLYEMNIVNKQHRLTILERAQNLLLELKKKYGTSNWICNKKHKPNLYKYSQPSTLHLAQSYSNPVNPPINVILDGSDGISSEDTGFPDIGDQFCTIYDIMRKAHYGPNGRHAPSHWSSQFECMEDSDSDCGYHTFGSLSSSTKRTSPPLPLPLQSPRGVGISIKDDPQTSPLSPSPPCLQTQEQIDKLLAAKTYIPTDVTPKLEKINLKIKLPRVHRHQQSQAAQRYIVGHQEQNIQQQQQQYAASNDHVLFQSTTKEVSFISDAEKAQIRSDAMERKAFLRKYGRGK